MKAILTIGISGSGKSTFAGMTPGFTVISRDDIRFGIVSPKSRGWLDYSFTDENEKMVTEIEKRMWREAAENGESIICANTFLGKKARNKAIEELRKLGYEVEIVEFPLELEAAIERDSHRGWYSVGESVIKNQYDQWVKYQAAKTGPSLNKMKITDVKEWN